MQPRKLAMIVAATPRGEIGCNNQIPWKLSGDLKRFKEITMGHVVIMGRKTFESIGSNPLPGRLNVVISKTLQAPADESYQVYPGIDEALCALDAQYAAAAKKLDEPLDTDLTFFLMGGVGLYQYGLQHADTVYWTIVHDRLDRQPQYDTVIPDFHFPESQWTCTAVIWEGDSYLQGTEIPLPSHTWVTLERSA